MQLFSGVYEYRCRLSSGPIDNGTHWSWPIDPDYHSLCTPGVAPPLFGSCINSLYSCHNLQKNITDVVGEKVVGDNEWYGPLNRTLEL